MFKLQIERAVIHPRGGGGESFIHSTNMYLLFMRQLLLGSRLAVKRSGEKNYNDPAH